MTGRAVAATSPHRSGAPECRSCGAPIGPDRAMRGSCGAAVCEARLAEKAARAEFQRGWQDHVAVQRRGIERAATGIAAAVHRLGRPPEEIAFGVVPRQVARLVQLSESRRAAFAAHLQRIVSAAFASGEPVVDLGRREACERDEEPLADAACATCGGRCCMLGGGTHAFLTVEAIQLHRARNPEATGEQIVAHYLSRLPDASVEHSCVYHGARGCVLPRRERADVCNRYHCNPQSDLLRRFRGMSAGAAVIVADDGETEPAVAVFDHAGWRPQRSAPGEAIPPERLGQTVAAALGQMPAELTAEMPTPPGSEVWHAAESAEALSGHAAGPSEGR